MSPAYGLRQAAFASYGFPTPDMRTTPTGSSGRTNSEASRAGTLYGGGDIERETGDLVTALGETPLSPTRTSYGAFVQDQIALSSRAFDPEPAGRAQRFDGNDACPPCLRGSGCRARGRLRPHPPGERGRGDQGASFFESYGTSSYALGNPDLAPERARTFDGGIELRLGDSLKAQATWFHHQYLDQIAYKVVS